jgi:integrase
MAQKIQRLSALAVTRAGRPGLYADGAGLYLRVNRNGSKSWAFRFMLRGKSREMGLGSLTKVTLADARTKAADARLELSNRRDPLALRRQEEAQRAAEEKLAANSAVTFDKCAGGYIAAHEASWKNEKHKQQWRNTIATYVSPVFGNTPVQDVDLDLVLKVIEPIWTKKAETARRIRGRIEVILDWARVRGYRSGENPARWRGQMDQLLPARSKVASVKHHSALPHSEVSEFMEELRLLSGSSAAALEFLILTAARTSEVVYARWTEIDFKKKVWIVPASRMKSGREHRVPLSSAAIAVVSRIENPYGDYVFPGRTPKQPLSDMSLLMTLGRMNRASVTVHGFRSTFRDWAAECTAFPNEVVEMALAHVIEGKTEAAYRRGDLLEKRRQLMDAWADYAQPKG